MADWTLFAHLRVERTFRAHVCSMGVWICRKGARKRCSGASRSRAIIIYGSCVGLPIHVLVAAHDQLFCDLLQVLVALRPSSDSRRASLVLFTLLF
jgi:hypothetical protein